ncbi:MAG: FtsX-like permease family protein [Acidobacteriota bacterium]
MLILRLGWRNLWRNPRRSLISISAVATAFVFLILLLGMSEGLKRQMLQNGTGLLLGQVQLHHPDYLPDRSLYDTLGDQQGLPPGWLGQLESRSGVEAAAGRLYGFALLSTGEHSAGARLIGIQPESEKRVSTMLDSLRGQALESDPGGQILLGETLAQQIDAQQGSQVAVVTQAADGSMGNVLYRVSGLLRTGLSALDRTLAVVHIRDLQDLLVLDESRFHEIALKIHDPVQADQVSAQINADPALPQGIQAKSWGELLPQLRDYLSLFENFYGFLIGFVAVFAALGVLNTMMMAVFERTREIGTVGALGMFPSQILTSFLVESLFLGCLGLALGLAVGALLMQPLTTQGLDLSRWTGELSIINTRLDPVIRFEWASKEVIWSAVGLLIAILLAGGLPARKAARMNPVQARHFRGEG